MAGVVISRWVEERTCGAPEPLRQRVLEFLDAAGGADDPAELAAVGDTALVAAMSAGSSRACALDLLAADALITLALLAAAERDPATLGATAEAIRKAAIGAR